MSGCPRHPTSPPSLGFAVRCVFFFAFKGERTIADFSGLCNELSGWDAAWEQMASPEPHHDPAVVSLASHCLRVNRIEGGDFASGEGCIRLFSGLEADEGARQPSPSASREMAWTRTNPVPHHGPLVFGSTFEAGLGHALRHNWPLEDLSCPRQVWRRKKRQDMQSH